MKHERQHTLKRQVCKASVAALLGATLGAIPVSQAQTPGITPSVPADSDVTANYLRQYITGALPPLDPVVTAGEFTGVATAPPRLSVPASQEQPSSIKPSRFTLTDLAIAAQRKILLQNDEVRRALGERFVDIASGTEVPAKPGDAATASIVPQPGAEESVRPTLVFEFFSYTNERAVRAGILDDRVTFVTVLPETYQPPEAQEEIARATRLVASDTRYQRLVQGTESEGLLTPCEQSKRCLYLQFVRPPGQRLALTATIDLLHDRIVDVVINPDASAATDGPAGSESDATPGRST